MANTEFIAEGTEVFETVREMAAEEPRRDVVRYESTAEGDSLEWMFTSEPGNRELRVTYVKGPRLIEITVRQNDDPEKSYESYCEYIRGIGHGGTDVNTADTPRPATSEDLNEAYGKIAGCIADKSFNAYSISADRLRPS